MMSVTFDSSAWIAYFAGASTGATINNYISSDGQIYTPSVCLMEIKTKYIQTGKPFEERVRFIEERSSIITITKEIALEAATLKASEGLPTIDALVYACARNVKTSLVTSDSHFKGKKGIEFLS